MGYLIAAMLAYLLGCSNMALYLSRLKKVNFRDKGSGNLGASNATLLLGWKAGVLVALHDAGKALLAVLLCRWLFPNREYVGAVAGIACVLGHIFPLLSEIQGWKRLCFLHRHDLRAELETGDGNPYCRCVDYGDHGLYRIRNFDYHYFCSHLSGNYLP